MSKELKQISEEQNIPLPILKKWKYTMDVLWNFLSKYKQSEKLVALKNKDNQIVFQLHNGNVFNIKVNMYNNKYISLSITIEGHEDFESSISHINEMGQRGIIENLASILTHAEKIKV